MQPILNDVYWINTGFVNCFLCYDDSGLCLIDTGMSAGAGKIKEALAEIGCAPGDITRILLTHADVDHVRGLASCWKQSNAAVYAGAESAAFIASGKSPQHLPGLMQKISDAIIRNPIVPAEAISVVREGDKIPVLGGLEVVATPGHTMDHLSFFSPQTGVLFAGDSLSTRNGRLQRTAPIMTNNEDAANRSALRLLAMTPIVYACGHGAPLNDPSGAEAVKLANTIQLQMEELV